MSIEAEKPSLEEISDAELEKQIDPGTAISLSEDEHDTGSVDAAEISGNDSDGEEEDEQLSIGDEDDDEDSSVSHTSVGDESSVLDPSEADEEEEDETKAKDTASPMADLLLGDSDAEDEETDTDDEEEFFQKLESDINTDHLIIYHPELMQNNYQEIKAFCKVLRNKQGIIVDPLHTTLPFLTKYEKARVLGVRCKQLNNGADTFVTVPPNIISGMLIAEEELKQKKIPFIIRRPLPNGGSEYWRLEDLEIIEY